MAYQSIVLHAVDMAKCRLKDSFMSVHVTQQALKYHHYTHGHNVRFLQWLVSPLKS